MTNVPDITLPNGRRIGERHPCFVVAEIGQNHNGDVATADRLVQVAAETGCNAVKFQKRHIPSDMTRGAWGRPYTGPNSYGSTYGIHRERLELSASTWDILAMPSCPSMAERCFLFPTACDIASVDELEKEMRVPMYKVASRDLDNLPLIERIASTKKPIILSTGMADNYDIAAALNVVRHYHRDVVLLHCTSEYPTQPQHVNLWRMIDLKNKYGVLTGLSDHTSGIVAAQAAAALGAVMVEKHLTLSRAGKGTDHAASLEPDGMARLVRNIRLQHAMMMGPDPDVSEARAKLGRSVVSATAIPPGAIITEDMLCLKSPGDGIRWRDRGQLLGKVARRQIPTDVTLDISDVQEPQNVEAN